MQEGARTRQSGSGRKPNLSGRSAAAAPSPAPARLRQPPPSWSAPLLLQTLLPETSPLPAPIPTRLVYRSLGPLLRPAV